MNIKLKKYTHFFILLLLAMMAVNIYAAEKKIEGAHEVILMNATNR